MFALLEEASQLEKDARLLLAGLVLVVSLMLVLWPVAIVQWRARPRGMPRGLGWFAEATTKAWGSAADWIPVFMLGNGVALFFSLYGARGGTASPGGFFETMLEDPLLCSQIGALLLAMSLIASPVSSENHAVRSPESARWFWVSALAFAIGANLVALVDTCSNERVGPVHRAIWVVENAVTIAFYAIPLLLFIAGRFDTLNGNKMSKLWWLVLLLVVFVVLDHTVPLQL